MAYSVLAEGRNERQLEELDIELGMIEDPDAEALEQLAAWQKSMGKTAVNPGDLPVLKPVKGDERL